MKAKINFAPNDKRLTHEERRRVIEFLEAAENLPPSIKIACEDPDDDDEGEDNLIVRKQVDPYMAVKVAGICKPSLYF